jgi:hypothetical protein
VPPKTYKNKGVCHNTLKGPLPFTYKEFLMAKEELWTLKNISPCKNIIFPKSSKRI